MKCLTNISPHSNVNSFLFIYPKLNTIIKVLFIFKLFIYNKKAIPEYLLAV